VSMVIDLGARRIARLGVRPGGGRFMLELPRSLNGVWEGVWCARERVRVLIEVLPGGDGDCGDRRDVVGRAGTI